MSNDNSLSLPELNDRIAVLRDNIRQLWQSSRYVEQLCGLVLRLQICRVIVFQLKSGRTPPPLLPQALHTKRGSRSESRRWSGH
jgi:hypothetical protein